MEKKKTLVLGASPNPSRYSNMCIRALANAGQPVEAVGLRTGSVAGVTIQTGQPALEGIHTVTLYMSAANQRPLYDYILSLHPRRVIFNPGTANPELAATLKENGIETVHACTLVMLASDDF